MASSPRREKTHETPVMRPASGFPAKQGMYNPAF